MNSVRAAQSPHTFLYRGWEVESKGNPLSHTILRGYVDKEGKSHPNYGYDELSAICETYLCSGLANPAVIIDTNHANSSKNHLKQPEIVEDVLNSTKKSADMQIIVQELYFFVVFDMSNNQKGYRWQPL